MIESPGGYLKPDCKGGTKDEGAEGIKGETEKSVIKCEDVNVVIEDRKRWNDLCKTFHNSISSV